ncbi:MAG TPA: sigma factor-like helix-turn-helix DNA-binding protein [Polyangiaceae bacterium]|nr:sigma factor-like helix-turn-helix DNA-binding protein [Polyangiaceae bacterium]
MSNLRASPLRDGRTTHLGQLARSPLARHEHLLEQVGERFGVTRERIRQIEGKALPPLKLCARDLGSLLEGRARQ